MSSYSAWVLLKEADLQKRPPQHHLKVAAIAMAELDARGIPKDHPVRGEILENIMAAGR